MTLRGYEEAKQLLGYSFEALVIAAFKRADSVNVEKMKTIFPFLSKELAARDIQPGGVLPSDAASYVRNSTFYCYQLGEGGEHINRKRFLAANMKEVMLKYTQTPLMHYTQIRKCGEGHWVYNVEYGLAWDRKSIIALHVIANPPGAVYAEIPRA